MKFAIAFLEQSGDTGKTYVLRFDGDSNPRSVNDATLTLREQISKDRQIISERTVPVELLNYEIQM